MRKVIRAVSLDATWVRWVSKRVWNDRELDAGVLLIAMGIWMIFFLKTADASAWEAIFAVAPSWIWGGVMVVAGLSRALSAGRRQKQLAAAAALFSTCLWCSYAAVFWSQSPHSFGGILFSWFGYQGFKSFLRLRVAIAGSQW